MSNSSSENQSSGHSSTIIQSFSQKPNFDFIRKIGKGRFGRIYLILNKSENKNYVVKHIKKKYTKNVQNEIHILLKIKGKSNYLLNMKDYYTLKNNDIMILTEYIQNSIDLNVFIENNSLSNINYLFIIKELLLGLKSLHDLNIVHMDIKPKNILIYDKYKIKYIDFGFACEEENTEYLSRYRGTAQYMDPYMVNKEIDTFYNSKKADIWSLGITIYKLVHRKLPWKHKDKIRIKKEILKTTKVYSKNKFFSELIENMCVKKLRKRYDLIKLIELTLQILRNCQI